MSKNPWRIQKSDIGNHSIEMDDHQDGKTLIAFRVNPEFANLIAAAPEMFETIRWLAQTVHQAHHMDQPGTFRDCSKNTCEAAREMLAKVEMKEEI